MSNDEGYIAAVDSVLVGRAAESASRQGPPSFLSTKNVSTLQTQFSRVPPSAAQKQLRSRGLRAAAAHAAAAPAAAAPAAAAAAAAAAAVFATLDPQQPFDSRCIKRSNGGSPRSSNGQTGRSQDCQTSNGWVGGKSSNGGTPLVGARILAW